MRQKYSQNGTQMSYFTAPWDTAAPPTLFHPPVCFKHSHAIHSVIKFHGYRCPTGFKDVKDPPRSAIATTWPKRSCEGAATSACRRRFIPEPAWKQRRDLNPSIPDPELGSSPSALAMMKGTETRRARTHQLCRPALFIISILLNAAKPSNTLIKSFMVYSPPARRGAIRQPHPVFFF